MGADFLHHLPRWCCGFGAAGLAAYSFGQGLYRGDTALTVLLASLFLLLICTTDTLYAKIPNLFSLVLTVCGFILHGWLSGVAGLFNALLGLCVGFGLLILPYLLGGMGAGDVKALAALGALLGPVAVLQVALYMFLAGGLMSVLHYLFNRNLITKCRAGWKALEAFFYTRDLRTFKPDANGEALRFPYAAAIAFGFFAHVRWGDLI